MVYVVVNSYTDDNDIVHASHSLCKVRGFIDSEVEEGDYCLGDFTVSAWTDNGTEDYSFRYLTLSP